MTAQLLIILMFLSRALSAPIPAYPADATMAREYEVIIRQEFSEITGGNYPPSSVIYETNQFVPLWVTGENWLAFTFAWDNGCTHTLFVNATRIQQTRYAPYLPAVVAHEMAHGWQGVLCLHWDKPAIERAADLVALEIMADLADDGAWYSDHARAALYSRLYDLMLSEVVYQYATAGIEIAPLLDALSLPDARRLAVYGTWQEWREYPGIAASENAYFGETARLLLAADGPRLTGLVLPGGEFVAADLWALIHPGARVWPCLSSKGAICQ